MEHTTTELTPSEMEAVTKDMQTVLEKYDCEMQVISNIHILKRIPIENAKNMVKSPYDGTDTETSNDSPETNSSAKESGENGDGEPSSS